MSNDMNVFIGIDLGSTTTKAVLLDEDGKVLGRGITNSRSNYDVACAVARSEALVDARSLLVRRSLESDEELASRAPELLPAVERSFQESKYRTALRRLQEEVHLGVADKRYDAWRAALPGALDTVFEGMEKEVPGLFAEGAERRSDFFRDLASSAYMDRAEEISDPKTMPHDVLAGLFDKAILVVENEVLDLSFEDHVRRTLKRVLAGSSLNEKEKERTTALIAAAVETELVEASGVGTGYGRARLPFPKENIRSEILCHGLGAHATFPDTRTVLDIGGQDTKAIQIDDQGIVTSFQMNDRCAAGCGRYLGYIADEMNMGVHELGPMAMKSTRHVKINSTCTVFAGAELRDRLNLGQSRADILAGLHRAIMLRAMSLLARSGGVFDEFTFTGGVARNEAAVKSLVELVEENYGERILNISAQSIYTGSLGAAIFALRSWRGEDSNTEEAVA